MGMRCPACGRCPFAGGVCEDRVNRGRRFFLMGALALPVARKLEAVAPIVAPPVLGWIIDKATGAPVYKVTRVNNHPNWELVDPRPIGGLILRAVPADLFTPWRV